MYGTEGSGITDRVAEHVGQASAPEDDDLVVVG